MCERKFIPIKYMRPYSYANFVTFFSATRYFPVQYRMIKTLCSERRATAYTVFLAVLTFKVIQGQ